MAKPFVIKGLVQEVLPLQTFKSGFVKRSLVIVDDPDAEYPNRAVFDFVKDRVADLEPLVAGEEVSVSFYPEARSWTNPGNGETRWFSSLKGVKVERKGGAAATVAPAHAPTPARAPAQVPANDLAADPESLPF